MIGYLRFLRVHKLFLIILAGGAGLALAVRAGTFDPNLQDFPDPTGAVRTVSTTGSVDTANPFFQSLGTNGRACITCHQPSDAWTVTPPHIQERFAASSGEDPIFRPVDGANCPSADVSTEEAREQAYSMLLNKGLIRICRSLFSYQIFIVCSPLPTLEWLLAKAETTSKEKIETVANS